MFVTPQCFKVNADLISQGFHLPIKQTISALSSFSQSYAVLESKMFLLAHLPLGDSFRHFLLCLTTLCLCKISPPITSPKAVSGRIDSENGLQFSKPVPQIHYRSTKHRELDRNQNSSCAESAENIFCLERYI